MVCHRLKFIKLGTTYEVDVKIPTLANIIYMVAKVLRFAKSGMIRSQPFMNGA
ncbi:hypothetical protein FM106_05870 [Brachybacterium faecium]|nr:hypothetical protein FM106_05870 [Brachybacterium faecium]